MKENVTTFDLTSAFKALDDIETPVAEKGIAANRINLTETLKRKDKTELLVEDYYDVSSTDELEDAQEDREAEVAQAKLARIEKIVDLDAKSPDDLLPSYAGKVIIQCPQCMQMFYKNEEDIEKDEEDPTLCNINEPCQHCGNISGYTIIGKVAPVEADEMADFTGETEGDDVEGTEDDIDLELGGETEEDEFTLDFDEPTEEVDTEDDFDLDLNLDEEPEEEEEEEETNESLNTSNVAKPEDKSENTSENKTLNEEIEATNTVDLEPCDEAVSESEALTEGRADNVAAYFGTNGFVVTASNLPGNLAENETVKKLLAQNFGTGAQALEKANAAAKKLANAPVVKNSNAKIKVGGKGANGEDLAVYVWEKGKISQDNFKYFNKKQKDLNKDSQQLGDLGDILDGKTKKDKKGNPEALFDVAPEGSDKVKDEKELTTHGEAGTPGKGEKKEETTKGSLAELSAAVNKLAYTDDKGVERIKLKGGKSGKLKLDTVLTVLKMLKDGGVLTEALGDEDLFLHEEDENTTEADTTNNNTEATTTDRNAEATTTETAEKSDGQEAAAETNTETTTEKPGLLTKLATKIAGKLLASEKVKGLIAKYTGAEVSEVEDLLNSLDPQELVNIFKGGASTAEKVKEVAQEIVDTNDDVDGTAALTGEPEAAKPAKVAELKVDLVKKLASDLGTDVKKLASTLKANGVAILAESLTEAEIQLPADDEISNADFVKMTQSDEFQDKVSEKEVKNALDTTDEALDINNLEEVDETTFESCIEESLKNVYENVKSFTLTNCEATSNGKLVFEGLIVFNSGNTKSTTYTFDKNTLKESAVQLRGTNSSLTSNGKFIIEGLIENNTLKANKLSYDYRVGTTQVKGSTK